MAMAIAEVTATDADLRASAARDLIAARWAGWAADAKDVGVQTRTVLSAATRAARLRDEAEPTSSDLTLAAVAQHARTGRSGGNGSLMRTAPVALAFLHDPDAMVQAAQEISSLTHPDPEAGEACALWCLAIRHAVLEGTLNIRNGLEHLPPDRAHVWVTRLDEAEAGQPADFEHNGWVVQALQGAWSAITMTATSTITTAVPPAEHSSAAPIAAPTPTPTNTATGPSAGSSSAGSSTGPAHFQRALEAAVRGGRDTDTVAAIAGGLIGGLYGASAVPAQWRRPLHGWPGVRARDLVRLAVMTARGGRPGSVGWPAAAQVDYSAYRGRGALARHPHDDGVWIGGIDALSNLPDGVDAVVSLCRLGETQVPAPVVATGDHVEFRLIDDHRPDKNPNLDFVLTEAAAAMAALRAEGRTVLLHCVQAQSRTPAVAALYGARLTGRTPDEVLAEIAKVLPQAHPNAAFRAALERLG
jgi:ADP-ribosylglycohydrolase/protein-tyrosine phosphatase